MRSPHVRLRPLPLDAANLADGFWKPRRRINREVTLPSQYRHLEDRGRLDNFRRASGKSAGEYQGIYFNDSDVYKWLEAAAWTLAEGSDPELERMVLRWGCNFSISDGLAGSNPASGQADSSAALLRYENQRVERISREGIREPDR